MCMKKNSMQYNKIHFLKSIKVCIYCLSLFEEILFLYNNYFLDHIYYFLKYLNNVLKFIFIQDLSPEF